MIHFCNYIDTSKFFTRNSTTMKSEKSHLYQNVTTCEWNYVSHLYLTSFICWWLLEQVMWRSLLCATCATMLLSLLNQRYYLLCDCFWLILQTTNKLLLLHRQLAWRASPAPFRVYSCEWISVRLQYFHHLLLMPYKVGWNYVTGNFHSCYLAPSPSKV